MYGGVSNGATIGEVWVLTLLTFHWVKTGSGVDKTRSGHTCTKVRGTYMRIEVYPRWIRFHVVTAQGPVDGFDNTRSRVGE